MLVILTTCAAPAPSPSQPSASSEASASMRAFSEDDAITLLMQDDDIPGVQATHDGRAGQNEEPTDAEWTEHLTDHGLKGRWWSGVAHGDTAALGYAFILGARVSLWIDANAATEALEFENSSGQPTLSGAVPELGTGAACEVLDWGSLADRAWCRFAVSNATFDVYIRTGDQTNPELDSRAERDLARLALRLRERAESLAVEEHP